jgi:hypothetical protein
MADGPRRKISGRIVHDPVMAAQAEARRRFINDSIYGFVEGLPLGDNGNAPEAVPYTQPDASTCFYASLGGIATSIHGRRVDIQSAATQSRSEGLLAATGAETHPEDRDRQVDLVRRLFSINIHFIDQYRGEEESIHALTQGLIEGKPVVFGLPHHWIALDGLQKTTGRGSTWKGMNPYPQGRRIEAHPNDYLTPNTVVDRLISADMPVVVVEGAVRRRLQGRIVPATPRFGPAKPEVQRFRPARRMKRVN